MANRDDVMAGIKVPRTAQSIAEIRARASEECVQENISGCVEAVDAVINVDKRKVEDLAKRCKKEKILPLGLREMLNTAPNATSFTLWGAMVNRLELATIAGLLETVLR